VELALISEASVIYCVACASNFSGAKILAASVGREDAAVVNLAQIDAGNNG
jgi:hypothetical protein